MNSQENPFSLRELADVQGCASVAGGRKPGATRMRGYKLRPLSNSSPGPRFALPNPLPEGEGGLIGK
jgi:hypothetical protein